MEFFHNKRLEPKDFSKKYSCSFCPNFNSILIKLPNTELLICKGCLSSFMGELDKEMMKTIKKESRL